jgi:hypothetical protein
MPLEAASRLACRGIEIMMLIVWFVNVLFNALIGEQKNATCVMQNGQLFLNIVVYKVIVQSC